MQQISQVMVFQLRDSVIQVDTFITEDELRARYESEAPALQVRARHIMLQLPIQATSAQRDSVAEQLRSIRDRATSGESFATLAAQYSQDPGSAPAGGDLGFFGRGDMVAPFEEAALALEPGDISDVVETPMGLHLIQLEERRVQGFQEAAAQFRRQVQGRMVTEAESVFVARLVDRVQPEILEGAADLVRDVAQNPGSQLSGRASRRGVVEWIGGAVTLGELQELMQLETPQLRMQLAESEDEQIDEFLQSLARRELLIQEAEVNGLRPERDSVDVLVDDARVQLREAARMLGLLDLDQAPGEELSVAVSRAVEEALVDNLTGATQVVPLGMVSFQLREGQAPSVFEAGVGQVIVDIANIRSARALSPLEESLDSALVTPDTTRS